MVPPPPKMQVVNWKFELTRKKGLLKDHFWGKIVYQVNQNLKSGNFLLFMYYSVVYCWSKSALLTFLVVISLLQLKHFLTLLNANNGDLWKGCCRISLLAYFRRFHYPVFLSCWLSEVMLYYILRGLNITCLNNICYS